MQDQALQLMAPWRLGEKTPITVKLGDASLVGSKKHFLRIDCYPSLAPSHPFRHFAYWDIPTKYLKNRRFEFTFDDNFLVIHGGAPPKRYRPQWSSRPFIAGYCKIIVSIWKKSFRKSTLIASLESSHLFLHRDYEPPLEWVQLSVTERCNLTCPHCTRQSAALSNQDVSDDVLSAICNAVSDAAFVGIQGIGEPLLNPKLPKIVEALRKSMPAYARLALTTNGTLLKPDLARKIIDTGINTITFSIDGASKEVYEKHRVGAKFDSLIENIDWAVKYGRRQQRDDLWFCANFIMMEDTVLQIVDFVRMCGRLGMDAIYFFHGRTYPDGHLVQFDQQSFMEQKAKAFEMAKGCGIQIKFANTDYSAQNACSFMHGVYLWLNGDVMPCHHMEPPGCWNATSFGNICDEPLVEIWNKPEYVAFRRTVLNGVSPQVCAGCSFIDSVTSGL